MKPSFPLTNKYCQNEPRFNGGFSRDNLPKIKDEAYIINLDEHLILELIGVLWMWIITMLLILIVSQYSMFQKKLKYLLTIKTLKQTFSEYKHTNSVMCGYFCIGFIDFMFKGKTLT